MTLKKATARILHGSRVVIAFVAMMNLCFGPLLNSARADDNQTGDDNQGDKGDKPTRTPIKHVIIIVGENRTFDHIFATYKPKDGRERKQSSFRGNYQRGRNSRVRTTQRRTSIRRTLRAARVRAEPHDVEDAVLAAPRTAEWRTDKRVHG